MFEIRGKYTTARVMINNVEESCVGQITHFTNHPAFTNPVAIMPDTHSGKGSVIGFTMPLSEKIIPNVVGVDVGCGMRSMNFGKVQGIGTALSDLDRSIRNRIPFGKEVHEDSIIHMEREFPWSTVNALAQKFAQAYREHYGEMSIPHYDMAWFTKKCDDIGGNIRRMINSLGTLGSGNHFIETGVADNGEYWITIHSGSRNFGKRICEYWQGKAEKFHRRDNKSIIQDQIVKLKTVVLSIVPSLRLNMLRWTHPFLLVNG
jgi:RNA-splicing ligase RtcB